MKPSLLLLVLPVFACKPKDSPKAGETVETGDSTPVVVETGDSGEPPVDPNPSADFDRFCQGAAWDSTLVEGVVGELPDDYAGYYPGLVSGTLESMKFIPQHPFQVTTLRVSYAHGHGLTRLRLMTTMGRSYPGNYPDYEDPAYNLMEPIDFEVPEGHGAQEWFEIDVSDRAIFLEPTQHYVLLNEYLEDDGPTLGIAPLGENEGSRALILVPRESEPYGVDGNYRMELKGNFFCSWDTSERWFTETTSSQPFAEDVSANGTIADLNGDGHQDLVVYSGGPKAYFGDGAGSFTTPDPNPFAAWSTTSIMIFGDLDNDGDQDAVAVAYVTADSDGDGQTVEEGDCNDQNTDSMLGATEIPNGVDDDCDGLADEDLATADLDGDGWTLADGDCNDDARTRYPGAEELGNHRDDDCDGWSEDPTDTADYDGDGFSMADGDCHDGDETAYPGAPEVINGTDDDCDGVADEGLSTADLDGDGIDVESGDCDDTQASVHPGAVEVQDGRDNDCSTVVDDTFHHRILLNDGTGIFTELENAGVEYSEPTPAGAFGDGNNDGKLDLYLGNWLELYPNDAAVQDRYFEGNGDGTMTFALDEAGLRLETAYSVYGVEWNDWNNDGFQDIFVGNYHLFPNQLWENQGDGTFVDVAVEIGVAYDDIPSGYATYPGGHTYGGDFGDVDNDGDMDFYMCNLSHPRTQPWADPSMFVINQGAPDYLMENLREEYGFIYDEGDVNATFADYDNDMDVDIAIASLYTQHYSRLYRNDGAAGFTDVTYETNTAVEESVSVLWIDVDEDGDEDLFVGDRFAQPYAHLFINDVGQDNHWVDIIPRGTTSNRDAVGARVTLVAGGVTQMRDIQGSGGLSSAERPKIAHFGLAGNTTIDSVTVRWVGGATETFTGVGADDRWLLVEGNGVAVEP